MKRETKFRAFDKEEKFMLYGIENSENHRDIQGNEYDGYEDWNFGDFLEDERMEVMQYTGLKDKNKVEIYERDIVKRDYILLGKPKTEIFEIIWWSGVDSDEYAYNYTGFRVRDLKDKKYHYGISSNPKKIRCYGHYGIDTEDLEVIGNIYENKELLTNKK